MLLGAITNSARYPTSGYHALMTSGGGASVKGAYSDFTASSTFAADGMFYQPVLGIINNRSGTVDVSTGAAGAEVFILRDVLIAWGDAIDRGNIIVESPISIPVSTRICGRWQCNIATSGLYSGCFIYTTDGLYSTFTSVQIYGPNPASSNTTSINSGGVANTKGAYSQVTASTTADTRAICIKTTFVNSVPGYNNWLMDVATGAGGAESIKLSNLHLYSHIDDMFSPVKYDFGIAIPVSTRIAARAQGETIEAFDRTFTLGIIGYAGTGSASSGGSSGGSFVSMQ